MKILALMAMAAVLGGQTLEKVRNDRVVAAEVSLAAGESESARPGLRVWLEPGSVDGAAVQRGEVRFGGGIRNTGKTPIRYVRVEFPGGGSGETWGATGLAPHYKLLMENRYTRVYDIRIPAHTDEPQHTHHDRVVICLSGAKLEHLYPDGRREPSTLATGEVVWRRGGTHIGQNLGDTDLWVIAVEPK